MLSKSLAIKNSRYIFMYACQWLDTVYTMWLYSYESKFTNGRTDRLTHTVSIVHTCGSCNYRLCMVTRMTELFNCHKIIWKCRLQKSSAVCKCSWKVLILAYRQTVWTQIILLTEGQSDLGLHSLPQRHFNLADGRADDINSR